FDAHGLGGLAIETLKPIVASASVSASGDVLTYGRLALAQGDRAEYRRACDRLLHIYQNDEERGAYDVDTGMIYALPPDSGIDAATALRAGTAGLHRSADDHERLDWSRGYLGAIRYRAGDFVEAVSLIDQVLAEANDTGSDHAPFTTHYRL